MEKKVKFLTKIVYLTEQSNEKEEAKEIDLSKPLTFNEKFELKRYSSNIYKYSKNIESVNKSNREIKEKIEKAKVQYANLLEKMKKSHMEDDEQSLSKKIKQIEREIFVTQNEIDGYKRGMESLKNRIEFKINLEKSMNIENLVKQEKAKNKELTKEYENLIKLNSGQKRVIDIYDKSTGYPDKIDLLKGEVRLLKEGVKDFWEKNQKQERYVKHIHEKIATVENQVKKLNMPKYDYVKKSFTDQELQDSLDTINGLKAVINECKLRLKNNVKANEDKLSSYISLNQRVEQDFKENERVKIF